MVKAEAIEHVKMLVGHRVGVIDARDLLHAHKASLELLLLPLHHDDTFPGVVSRSPEEIILVPADRAWQAVLRTEKINCASLAVVLGEDCRPVANV